MIPVEWLKKKVTIAEVEAKTRLDGIRKVLPFTVEDKDVVDKSDWYKESALAGDARWNSFKSRILPYDELWEYSGHAGRGAVWSTLSGMHGYCIIRNGEIVDHLPTGI